MCPYLLSLLLLLLLFSLVFCVTFAVCKQSGRVSNVCVLPAYEGPTRGPAVHTISARRTWKRFEIDRFRGKTVIFPFPSTFSRSGRRTMSAAENKTLPTTDHEVSTIVFWTENFTSTNRQRPIGLRFMSRTNRGIFF